VKPDAVFTRRRRLSGWVKPDAFFTEEETARWSVVLRE
jgi:hypothetical protein